MSRIKEIVEKIRVWGMTGIINFIRQKHAFAIQGKRLSRLARTSNCSAPVRGITVVGDITARVALSKTLRDFILNLKDAGIPCQAYDTCLKPDIPPEDAERVVTPPAEFDLLKYSHIVMMFRSPLPKAVMESRVCARIAFHDSEHGIDETLPFLRKSGDAIIAMSDFNFNYFKKAFADQPVFKVTYPFRFKAPEATPRDELRRKYGMCKDDFVVFFNFDFGSYCRKNIPAALKAFASAFAGDTSAKLLFKTKGATENPKRVAEMTRLATELGIGSQIIHIADYLPRADVDGLTAASDVYLSLHKSEGFGLGMAEAMSQGIPVVATNWSANTEFCRPETAWCVPYSMTPILPHEYPPSMKEWAKADAEAAAKMLREIRDNPEAAREKAEAGRRFMANRYSLARFKADVESLFELQRP